LPLLLLARSGLGAAVPAAETAAVRRLVDPDDLPAANAALAATWSAAYVLGMAAGGAAAMLGPTLALALDAGTFAVAAWLHGGLPPLPVTRARVAADHRRGRGPERHRRRDDHRVARSAAPGRAPRQEPGRIGERRGWIGLNLIAASAQPFGPAALSLGILQAVRGVGTGVGPWLAGRYLAGGGDPGRAQRVALATLLAALPALAVARSPVALIAVALVWGARHRHELDARPRRASAPRQRPHDRPPGGDGRAPGQRGDGRGRGGRGGESRSRSAWARPPAAAVGLGGLGLGPRGRWWRRHQR
jgi:hypothetical protein